MRFSRFLTRAGDLSARSHQHGGFEYSHRLDAAHLFEHEPRFVYVDVIGYGWAVAGNLRLRHKDGEVIDVNVNTEARDKSRFRRLRDELWWEVRDEFQNGLISIPDDPTLIEELCAYHYKEDEHGLIKIESKEELRERGFDSTNKADCLMMRRFYTPLDVQRMKGSSSSSRNQQSDVDWRTG